GTMTITDSIISYNSSQYYGGGISNYNGTLTVTSSTLSGNHAPVGGGLSNAATTVTVINSTVSGNTANSGGGIWNNVFLTILSSTLSGNIGGGLGGSSSFGPVSLKNTILKNDPSGSNCMVTIASQGHNLSSDASCAFAGPGDMSSVDPLLGPLDNNGGPTPIHVLLPGSPAIDAGSSDCPPPATDQR